MTMKQQKQRVSITTSLLCGKFSPIVIQCVWKEDVGWVLQHIFSSHMRVILTAHNQPLLPIATPGRDAAGY